jgi:CDP-diacylglycerol--glycerol-3-phosphate 3-phosphatidyltransferase
VVFTKHIIINNDNVICFSRGDEMKVIPNCISFSRIIFSLALILVKPLGTTFYTIYIICGFSDIIDGFIARKTGTTSRFGAKLDSIADMIMIGVLLFLLYPIINPKIEIIIWVILIGIIRLIAMIMALKKYKIFASIHTCGNKITGIIVFLFPILIPYIHTTVLMYIICVVASISAIEELIIQLTSDELQLNKQSIFKK